VRRATADDSRLLFDGRNAESVRRASLSPEPIGWEAHQAWLAASLLNPGRLLLIAEAADGPVGVLRYDLAGSRAQVSLYLFQGRAGLGWGRALLARGEVAVGEHWPQVTVIDAQVLPDNPASIELFRHGGYVQSVCRFERVVKDQHHD